MREEERVCIVLYRYAGGHPRYAVLRRVKNWDGWELPKGRMEGNAEETARLELEEETGIDELESLEPFDHELEWTYREEGEEVHVTCHCFVAQAPEDARIDVGNNPDGEHEEGYFLNFRDARDILTYEDQRELLEAVHRVLGG